MKVIPGNNYLRVATSTFVGHCPKRKFELSPNSRFRTQFCLQPSKADAHQHTAYLPPGNPSPVSPNGITIPVAWSRSSYLLLLCHLSVLPHPAHEGTLSLLWVASAGHPSAVTYHPLTNDSRKLPYREREPTNSPLRQHTSLQFTFL